MYILSRACLFVWGLSGVCRVGNSLIRCLSEKY